MLDDRLIRLRADAAVAWHYVDTPDALANEAFPIVSLALLEAALARNDLPHFGVRLGAGEAVEAIAPALSRIAMVELVFPVYRDGRHYSSARILRDQLHFTGEIRATGDVLVDQAHFLVRSGFDALALAPGVDRATVEQALARWHHVYQASSDSRTPVWQTRSRGTR